MNTLNCDKCGCAPTAASSRRKGDGCKKPRCNGKLEEKNLNRWPFYVESGRCRGDRGSHRARGPKKSPKKRPATRKHPAARKQQELVPVPSEPAVGHETGLKYTKKPDSDDKRATIVFNGYGPYGAWALFLFVMFFVAVGYAACTTLPERKTLADPGPLTPIQSSSVLVFDNELTKVVPE